MIRLYDDICDINNLDDKRRWSYLSRCSCSELQQLKQKVDKQEKTISQLTAIIGITNSKLSDMLARQHSK